MQAVLSFVLAHEQALCTIAGILLQEFVRKAKWIDGNTIGQAAYNYASNWLGSHSQKPAEEAQAGK